MDPANIRFTNFKTLVNSGASVKFLHKLTLKYQCSTIYPLRELVYQAPGGPKTDRFGWKIAENLHGSETVAVPAGLMDTRMWQFKIVECFD